MTVTVESVKKTDSAADRYREQSGQVVDILTNWFRANRLRTKMKLVDVDFVIRREYAGAGDNTDEYGYLSYLCPVFTIYFPPDSRMTYFKFNRYPPSWGDHKLNYRIPFPHRYLHIGLVKHGGNAFRWYPHYQYYSLNKLTRTSDFDSEYITSFLPNCMAGVYCEGDIVSSIKNADLGNPKDIVGTFLDTLERMMIATYNQDYGNSSTYSKATHMMLMHLELDEKYKNTDAYKAVLAVREKYSKLDKWQMRNVTYNIEHNYNNDQFSVNHLSFLYHCLEQDQDFWKRMRKTPQTKSSGYFIPETHGLPGNFDYNLLRVIQAGKIRLRKKGPTNDNIIYFVN